MVVHIIFIIAFVFSIPDLNDRVRMVFFTFFILFLFLALRYDYGNDYMSYYKNYIDINNGLPAWGHTNILYKYLNLLAPTYEVFIAIISLFYIISIHYLMRSNLNINNYWFAIIILLLNPYLFLVHLSSLRQTIAICIFIFAVDAAVKRKSLLYFLLILAATGFHSSAIILMPIYFIANTRRISKNLILLIFIGILILIATPLFETVIYFVLNKLSLASLYQHYFEQGLQNSFRATMIASIFFFVIIFNINKLEGREIIYAKLSLIASIISILAYKLSMLSRVGMYFDVFLIVTLPHILNIVEKKLTKQILFIIIIAIYLLKYISFFNNPLWEGYNFYKIISIKKII